MATATHRTPGETFAGYTDLAVLTCGNCGVMFAMPTAMNRARHEDHGTFYCPNGHGRAYHGETAEEKLANEREYRAVERAARERIEASERAQRAAAKRARNERDKIRRRVAHGVCPCCKRTFKQLSRHMAAKHPEFAESEAVT